MIFYLFITLAFNVKLLQKCDPTMTRVIARPKGDEMDYQYVPHTPDTNFPSHVEGGAYASYHPQTKSLRGISFVNLTIGDGQETPVTIDLVFFEDKKSLSYCYKTTWSNYYRCLTELEMDQCPPFQFLWSVFSCWWTLQLSGKPGQKAGIYHWQWAVRVSALTPFFLCVRYQYPNERTGRLACIVQP